MDRPQINIERRIKKHIHAKQQTFFAAFPPGLEGPAEREFRRLLPDSEPEVSSGGITWQGKMEEFWALHYGARIPNRISWRIGTAKATGFGELETKLTRLEWELFLDSPHNLIIDVSVTHCRLYMKEEVENRVKRAVQERFLAQGLFRPKTGNELKKRLTIRGVDDRFTLSLSGDPEPLYKRGVLTHRTEAPLRETLASAILEAANLRNYKTLYDPMCGSGTFSSEAAAIKGGRAPGEDRSFGFQSWPSFRPGTWNHIKRQYKTLSPDFPLEIVTSDADSKAIDAAAHNLKEILPNIPVVKDFFSSSESRGPGLVVLNPPYGRRIPGGTKALYRKIGDTWRSSYPGSDLAILLPQEKETELRRALGIKFTETYSFKNGGLKVVLGICKRNP